MISSVVSKRVGSTGPGGGSNPFIKLLMCFMRQEKFVLLYFENIKLIPKPS